MALNVGALPSNAVVVTIELDDVSTASSAWAVCPTDGRIIYVGTILHGAITGANAAVTFEINGTAIAGLSLTITQSGSAAGDVDSADVNDIPTAYVKRGDKLELITDGASTTARRLTATVIILQ